MNNEFNLEWAKRGGVIVASYSYENNGDGGSFNKSFLVKRLAENVFIDAETLSEKGGFLAQESFRPEDIDDFYLVCMATREQCMDAGVEYIEPPLCYDEVVVLREENSSLEARIEELKRLFHEAISNTKKG